MYCLSIQLFANQRFDSDFLRTSLHSVLASGAAWARMILRVDSE